MGDFGPIETEMTAHPEFLFPDYFVRYLCQITIENSADPETSLERAKQVMENVLGVSQAGPGAFQMWNCHSCQLAVQLLEQLRDACLTEEALQQTATEGEPLEELQSSLQFRQIQYALILDGDLVSRLSQTSIDDAYQEIVKRLMNYGSPGRQEYFQALTAQWRIGNRSAFLDNVLAALDTLLKDSSLEARQAIVWAYQEAQLMNRRADAALLRRKLLEVAATAEQLGDIESVNASGHLEQALSPMARVALRSANWDLARASTDALLWKDAGMISLGFFRIIELELNERLIFPILQKLDIHQLDVSLANLKTGELNRTTKDAIAFWERMLPQLRRSKEERKGLELGALELLLAKTVHPVGPDGPLKAPINAEVLRLLTTAGAEAFKSGKLARLVDTAARERFRNPPAHSRYVGLPVARECKLYVENVLNQLIEFTVDSAGRAPTVH